MSMGVLIVNMPARCQLVMFDVETGEETPSVWLPISELARLEDLARAIEAEKPHIICQINQS